MKKFKDRKDGKRVKTAGMGQLIMDINPKRCDSEVYINQKIDVTNLTKYIKDKKKKGENITFFHAFVTAMGKTIYHRPKLNYFVANRHLYEHNELLISFVAKVAFDDKSEEVMIMVPIKKKDNVNTISNYVRDKVESIRTKKTFEKEGANGVLDTLGKLPNFIRVPLVGFLKWLDKKDMLPLSLQQDNLYYSTMIVSNLGTLKCGAIYHHLSDFGTCSSLATIGEIQKTTIINEKGKPEVREMVEFGITLDERVGDGYYFAKSINMFKYIIENPKLLEEDIESKVEFEDLK